MSEKTVLFVTYGGGHAAMVIPVLRALAEYPHIRCETLALTSGGVAFSRQGIPYKGFKDFITEDDAQALIYGTKLAAFTHEPSSGITQDEAVAYLGLSFMDLVQHHGEDEALKLWEQNQRGAFLPVSVLERIIKQVAPDMVVTTNSPRSERASVLAANALGIPTLSMVDLFALHQPFKLEATYLTVLSPRVIENLNPDAHQECFVTGNPAFDPAFDYRGPVDTAWRKTHFPTLPDNAKALLWIDDNGYLHANGNTHYRTEAEIVADLDLMAQATAQTQAFLLIRPHPSQDRAVFERWMRTAPPHALLAADVPLYPLLNACDAVAMYQSTVGLEALMVGRPVLQLTCYPAAQAVPLARWGLAREVAKRAELAATLRQAFAQEEKKNLVMPLPKEKAAPQIARIIADRL